LYSLQKAGAAPAPSIAQLRLISSMIKTQEFDALQGGCVAGETAKH
jgi:hypothetical protein